jgi:hypothetical protein
MEFVNRLEELKVLEEAHISKNASFVVIYGRRRLGKTELIRQFLSKIDNSVYYLATEENSIKQLKGFSSLVGIRLGDEDLARFGAADWESLFLRISKTKLKSRLTIVIDEFPHIVKADKAIPSIFQKGWELYMKESDAMLILCGSSINMMQNDVLNQASPLYQRNTAVIMLKPLGVEHLLGLTPGFKFMDALKAYLMFGGVPAYYVYIEGTKSFEGILERMFIQGSVFLDEISVILSEEVKNTAIYLDIIDFIANGVNRPSEIASKLAIPASNVIRYLNLLLKIGIVRRSMPVTKNVDRRSKSGIYEIADNYAFFWSRYIKKNMEKMALEGSSAVVSTVQNEFDSFASIMFERFSIDMIAFLSKNGRLSQKFTKLGRWWGIDSSRKNSENQEEIDIVALNEDTKEMLFAECKWTSKPTGIDVYMDLKRKSKLVQWHNDSRKEHFALFSKSGFTDGMKELAKKEGAMLFDLEAIEKELRP